VGVGYLDDVEGDFDAERRPIGHHQIGSTIAVHVAGGDGTEGPVVDHAARHEGAVSGVEQNPYEVVVVPRNGEVEGSVAVEIGDRDIVGTVRRGIASLRPKGTVAIVDQHGNDVAGRAGHRDV